MKMRINLSKVKYIWNLCSNTPCQRKKDSKKSQKDATKNVNDLKEKEMLENASKDERFYDLTI